MGTKWKKSKVICSLLFFVTGMSLLITYLVPAAGLFSAFGLDVFEGQPDYQESGDFRNLISNRLLDLLGVATGGPAYSVSVPDGTDTEGKIGSSGYYTDSTGAVYKNMDIPYEEWIREFQSGAPLVQEDTVAEESADYANILKAPIPEAVGGMDSYQDYLMNQQADYDGMTESAYGFGGVCDYGDSYFGFPYDDEERRDAHMANLAQDKNLRYAVVCQNKLLYSNIEGFEDKVGEEWKGEDFSKALDEKAYNFTLWYNKESDGKVQIVKDGHEENVYGDGVYTEQSRWRVPGYSNFTAGEKAKDAVIFLAAAKYPQLYVVGGDGQSGVTQYGSRLYRMRCNTLGLRNMVFRTEMFLAAAVVLLALSLLLRKSRMEGVKKIGGFLGKICLEGKLLLILVLAVFLTVEGVREQVVWWLLNGAGYYSWSGEYIDYLYEMKQFIKAGGYLTAWFWLLYLAALDFRMNRGRQKKPVFDLLKAKDFQYPVQKRLVKRQRRTLLAEIALLVLFAAAVCALWVFQRGLLNGRIGGYGIQYGYDTYGAVTVDEGYRFGMTDAWMLTACVIFSALFIFTMITAFSLKKNHRLAQDIGLLSDRILAVREGNLTGELTLSEDTDLREAADNLNQIQKGLEAALTERVNSERMKVELVTNVSHDIKTPLTSIISYVELLRQEQELPQHVKEYVQILGEKSARLKNIVQDVFEISKAASGQLPVQMEMLDMGKLLRQTLADMNDQISQSTLLMRAAIPETPVPVMADGQRLYRVFQNLLQNALCYSLEGSRVYLTLVEEGGQAVVRVKNTSSVELANSKDFTERFVRGDESRTDGGSGLGLSIAKSFTEACGGKLTVETDADLFTVTVRFDREENLQRREEALSPAGASVPGMAGGEGKEAKTAHGFYRREDEE